jgi:hypothetical protein
MTDGIEIHFDAEEGHLRLDCSEEQFVRIRDCIVGGAGAGNRFDAFVDGIRSILVRRTGAVPDAKPERFRGALRIGLVALAVGLSLIVQFIGIVAVIRWFLGKGP